MTETNDTTNRKAATVARTASQARGTTDRVTASAGRAAKKAAQSTDDAVSAVKKGTERAAEATGTVAHTAARGLESGRKALVTASAQVTTTAKAAWTVVAHRKLLAAGVGAGLTALSAVSYALGRRAERHPHGPLTRLTKGRI
ncbi:hypothetical protein ACE1SV_61130 [Streptomyces sp. E-15]